MKAKMFVAVFGFLCIGTGSAMYIPEFKEVVTQEEHCDTQTFSKYDVASLLVSHLNPNRKISDKSIKPISITENQGIGGSKLCRVLAEVDVGNPYKVLMDYTLVETNGKVIPEFNRFNEL